MSKNLPPYARRTIAGRFTAWTLDWGKGPHQHHHSTRKRLGAMKPISKFKDRPRVAQGTYFTRLKKRFRRYWSNLSGRRKESRKCN